MHTPANESPSPSPTAMPSSLSSSKSLALMSRQGSVLPSVSDSSVPNNADDDLETVEIKVIVIGESSVGKSSLLRRFCDLPGWNNAMMTCGVDIKIKRVLVNGKRIKLCVWDTAGHERYRSLTKQYYRMSKGVLLVYDVGNSNSFSGLAHWFSDLENKLPAEDYAQIPKILVGNKIDREREVTYEEGETYATSFGCGYVETSAFLNKGVSDAFLQLAERVLDSKGTDSQAVEQSKEKENVDIGKVNTENDTGGGGCGC